ncbi:MAG: PKD domain-containing protein, partial [Bacteroidota bacterium]
STISYTGVTGIWSLVWVATGDIQGEFPTIGSITTTNNLHTRNSDLALLIGGISSGTGSMQLEWIRARKWAVNTPTFSVGAENGFSTNAITLANDTTICGNDSIVIDAGAGFTNYSWNTGDMSQSIVASSAGDYIVQVTDSSGCPSIDTLVVDTFPAPAVDLGPDTTVCDGALLTLDAGTWSSYNWSTGDMTQSINVSLGGSYDVSVTNADGCIGTDGVVVNVIAAPTASFSTSTNMLTAMFTDASSSAVAWSWTFGDGNSSTNQSPTYTYTSAGQYVVCLTVTSSNGCDDVMCDTITVSEVGIADALPGLDVTLSPIPVDEWLNVAIDAEFAGNARLTILDLQGRALHTEGVELGVQDRVRIETRDYAAGFYFLRLETEQGVLLKKFMTK